MVPFQAKINTIEYMFYITPDLPLINRVVGVSIIGKHSGKCVIYNSLLNVRKELKYKSSELSTGIIIHSEGTINIYYHKYAIIINTRCTHNYSIICFNLIIQSNKITRFD